MAENNSVSMMIQIQYSDPEAAQEIPASNVVRETVEEAESKTAAAAAEERLAKVTWFIASKNRQMRNWPGNKFMITTLLLSDKR